MAITYPLDLLQAFPGWSTVFDLMWRQEQSRQTNGVTRVKDFGSPLWRATFQSRSMRPNELDEWQHLIGTPYQLIRAEDDDLEVKEAYRDAYQRAREIGDGGGRWLRMHDREHQASPPIAFRCAANS